ncbi:O-methyltransferase [Leekyejoonella antrihumi]|uniref:O-methyltransferase n=1 Tax=Leekyejoonella antrihumi TaxID=1660198 RepID=A0A563DU66_9MICO|nr:O-methyltransferase [Leekyejoonella antrihumi]TWP33729.1 O-methyltransferase [Leekyejoonella antrihumi]
MRTMRPATQAYAEEFVTEPEAFERARERGETLGCVPVGLGTGAALRMLAAGVHAHSVVEIGSGAGVSGLWLLWGMPDDGVLTTIDIDPEHQRAARQAYAEAGVPAQRTRVISGSALDVMPRLADGSYDMVLIDGEKSEYPQYVEQALRLLRPGGLLAIDNMLWHDRVADPAIRDETTSTLRDLGKTLRDDPDLSTALLPIGDGLLTAVKH